MTRPSRSKAARDVRAASELMRSAALASETGVAAMTTIGLRSLRFWFTMASPSIWSDPEWTKMVSEKMKAGMQVNAALTRAMLAAPAIASWDALRVAQTTTRALKPVHRAATANARRLSKPG